MEFSDEEVRVWKEVWANAEYGHISPLRYFMDQYNAMETMPMVVFSAILSALKGDRVETLKYFVEEEMVINNALWMSISIAHAFNFEKYYCAAYLLTLGLPMPAGADAPLVEVVRRGQIGVIGKILRQGYCNVNTPGRSGETALDVALRRKQWRVASMLMHAGGNVATWPAIGERVPYPKETQCPLVVRQLLGRVNAKRFLMMVYVTATPKAHSPISPDKQVRVTADDRRIKMDQKTQNWQNVMGQLVGVQGSKYIPSDVFVCVMKYV